MPETQDRAKHDVTVMLPPGLAQAAHIVTLSNRLALAWTNRWDFSVVFDGEIVQRVLEIIMEVNAERGLRWGITLMISADYGPSPALVTELVQCGFAVNIKDYRYSRSAD